VNVHTSDVDAPLESLRVSHRVEREQVRVLAERRAGRDETGVRAALDALVEAAHGEAARSRRCSTPSGGGDPR
jgi:methylmalonyl-CoA mutase N-terminal domain/subunit